MILLDYQLIIRLVVRSRSRPTHTHTQYSTHPSLRPQGSIRFGKVGAAEVAPDDDVLLVLLPQNMVGACLVPHLDRSAAPEAEAWNL